MPWSVSLSPAAAAGAMPTQADGSKMWSLKIAANAAYKPLPPTGAANENAGTTSNSNAATNFPSSPDSAAAQWHPDVLARFYVSVGQTLFANRNGNENGPWVRAKVLGGGPKEELGMWTIGDEATGGKEWREVIGAKQLGLLPPVATAAPAPGQALEQEQEPLGRWTLSFTPGLDSRYAVDVNPPQVRTQEIYQSPACIYTC